MVKFKSLFHAGRNATLTLNASAGQAIINLFVVLDDLPVKSKVKQPHHYQSRNGPSRLRRREKRAAVRLAYAENAAAEVSPEEVDLFVLAEEAVHSTKIKKQQIPPILMKPRPFL